MPIDSAAADTGSPEDSTVAEASTDSAPADTGSMVAETSADTAAVDSLVLDTTAADTTVVDTMVADTKVADTAVADTTTDTAVTCVGLAAPTCNAITMPATATTLTPTVGTIPSFTKGGTVPDGTYVLTQWIVSAAMGTPKKAVVSIVGTCLQAYEIPNTGAEVRANGSGSYNAATGTSSFTYSCPAVFTVAGDAYGAVALSSGKTKLITLSADGKDYREWTQQ